MWNYYLATKQILALIPIVLTIVACSSLESSEKPSSASKSTTDITYDVLCFDNGAAKISDIACDLEEIYKLPRGAVIRLLGYVETKDFDKKQGQSVENNSDAGKEVGQITVGLKTPSSKMEKISHSEAESLSKSGSKIYSIPRPRIYSVNAPSSRVELRLFNREKGKFEMLAQTSNYSQTVIFRVGETSPEKITIGNAKDF